MSRLLDNAKHNVDVLRNKRARLFKAFDIWKENVAYGIYEETQQLHDELVVWYKKCLELDYDAITNYPSVLDLYL